MDHFMWNHLRVVRTIADVFAEIGGLYTVIGGAVFVLIGSFQ